MITQTSMTLFHEGIDPMTRMETHKKQFFPNVSMQKDIVSTITDGGLKSANVIKIRVPVGFSIDIKNGDKVVIGECSDTTPPAEKSHTVIGYADNRKGSSKMWHWKVVCV